MKPITKKEVLKAQKAWGEAVVSIGKAYGYELNFKAAKKLATEIVNTAYGYNEGTVLFKPTKTEPPQQFRMTKQGAIAYFVGGSKKYPKDSGFALEPWYNVRFENAGFIFGPELTLAMGNYFFQDRTGKETMVEYTFGYKRGKKGNLLIHLQHSSLPFISD